MSANDDDAFGAFIQKLDRLTRLNEVDRHAIKALPSTVLSCGPGEFLVRERDYEASCCILLAGYACRHKIAPDGRRQIVSFHIPGDILDLQQVLFSVADHNVQTITDATYLAIPCEDLKRVANSHLNVGEALWRDTLIDASVFREWVLNVGLRNPKARIAHMLCEFAARLEYAGLVHDDQIRLPLTQEEIADATGLTSVHVNRTLAGMVAEGLIARQKGEVLLTDWSGMRDVAGFDPLYLHVAA